MLYPLKFRPRFKERIWGGTSLEKVLGKKIPEGKNIGESWEISGLQGDVSVVGNGSLKGNTLQELIEVYMGDLVGEKIYEKYGIEFPLLIKLIDARDLVSIQVHPNDQLAEERHYSYGKTEQWYIIDADANSELYLGFNRNVTREEYVKAVEEGTLASLLKKIEVKKGDSFFIPAGTVHSFGKGILMAEIQQTSDITYRIDDWGRLGANGKPRELHTQMAVDAVEFRPPRDLKDTEVPVTNEPVNLEDCAYFTTNLIKVEDSLERDYSSIDSFVIYICLEGSLSICFSAGSETLEMGETILIPAQEDNIEIDGDGLILEVYIK